MADLRDDGDIRNHDLMDAPDKLKGLLRGTGFAEIDVRPMRLQHRFDLAGFLDLQVRFLSAQGLGSLAPTERDRVVGSAGERLARLSSEDFVERTEVLFATARA